jgi:hypothetical protein
MTFSQLYNAIAFFLAVYGCATIIATEYLPSLIIDKINSKKWPKLYYFLTCNKCQSVWLGFAASLLVYQVVNPFVDALLAYSVTSLLNRVIFGIEPEE